MKRAGFAVSMVLLAATFALAQGQPDFSGSWTLLRDKSTLPPIGGGPGAPGGPGGRMGAGDMVGETMTITQSASELSRVSMSGVRALTRNYKLDGSETINAGGRGDVKSRSHWEGARLVTDSVREMQGPDGSITIETKETMSLDAGGNLVIESATRTPTGERRFTLVYKKAE